MRTKKTTVGTIDNDVLAFTAGRDVELDRALIEVDCLGTAAHVTMLSRMPVEPPLLTPDERDRVVDALKEIVREAHAGAFEIRLADQDVHLAVERTLTERLGDLGKKVHVCRSRNDQVALDLRLFARDELLSVREELAELAEALTGFGERYANLPMVGRTHMQPGMPSTVGLWATAHAEALLDDALPLSAAYELNDRSPLGSAAGYGVPLPIDRQLVADLLGFSGPIHNVAYANNARGKLESTILGAMSQIMLTLSRLAQDLMLYTMPEFDYFRLPAEYCTGSSIMPQKQNPDVCELVRAKASRVKAAELATYDLVKGSPTGYNRDLQEAKEPFMDGIAATRSCLRILASMIARTEANPAALRAGFSPDVFATDRALELVGEGMPFRDAYHHVKGHLDELEGIDPDEAVRRKTHLGASFGLDFGLYAGRIAELRSGASAGRETVSAAYERLLG